jgi:DNA/RNA-binding domain of Phe-tRNA-synthetase-like protein
MSKITVSVELAQKVPQLELACIECDVVLQPVNEELWNEIQYKIIELNSKFQIEDISKIPAILASRKAYKACGKDPARYRLSAEALLRRVVNRNEIYQINNVVDLLNLVSISPDFQLAVMMPVKLKAILFMELETKRTVHWNWPGRTQH